MEQIADIRKRMASVQSIQKMAKAMELISRVKSRQAKVLFQEALPFFTHCSTTLLKLLRRHPDFTSEFFDPREKPTASPWHSVILVMSSDRGLAGSYNQDVIDAARNLIAAREASIQKKGFVPDIQLKVMGRVGRHSLSQAGYAVDPGYAYDLNDPDYYEASDLTEDIMEAYQDHKTWDEVYMVYTRMLSPIQSEPVYLRLLPADMDGLRFILADLRKNPISRNAFERSSSMGDAILAKSPKECATDERRYLDDMETGDDEAEETSPELYDSSSELKRMLEYLFTTTLSGLVYGALSEAYASEQTARMTSMDNASRNSRELLKDLLLKRNKIRQAQITTELTEIVAGAEGLRRSGVKPPPDGAGESFGTAAAPLGGQATAKQAEEEQNALR